MRHALFVVALLLTSWLAGPAVLADVDASARLERIIIQQTNAERARYGLPPLQFDPCLTAAARQESNDMSTWHFFSHDSPLPGRETLGQRGAQAGFQDAELGENLAQYLGFNTAAAAQRVVHDWMNSPGHRANILYPGFSGVGVGLTRDGGRLLITQLFVVETPQWAARAAAARVAYAPGRAASHHHAERPWHSVAWTPTARHPQPGTRSTRHAIAYTAPGPRRPGPEPNLVAWAPDEAITAGTIGPVLAATPPRAGSEPARTPDAEPPLGSTVPDDAISRKAPSRMVLSASGGGNAQPMTSRLESRADQHDRAAAPPPSRRTHLPEPMVIAYQETGYPFSQAASDAGYESAAASPVPCPFPAVDVAPRPERHTVEVTVSGLIPGADGLVGLFEGDQLLASTSADNVGAYTITVELPAGSSLHTLHIAYPGRDELFVTSGDVLVETSP
jgi:hypothetical protein